MAEKITIRLPKIKVDIWRVATIILALILLAQLTGFLSLTGLISLSGQQVGEKVVNYINQNLVEPGSSAKLVSVKDTGSVFEIITSYKGNSITVYASKDGTYLFLQGYNMAQTTATTQPAQEIPKKDKPEVELYVMSFCPYGNRAENTMLPVYNLLKDKVDWKIYYIVSISGNTISSLHGQPEVEEDEREACVLTEYGLDKWWNFTIYVNSNCGGNGTCWEEAANHAGLDVNKITDCVNKKGLDLMKASESATNRAGVTGSPTLFINGVMSRAVYQYENSEAYKQAICQAFTSLPSECSEVLKSSGTSTGGQC
jgi:glutaredoxin